MSEIISSTIADRVAEQLRQDILQKKIPEESRITVKEISERYGVGLTPVRDAFQVLKSERLLEIVPYKHARVLSLDTGFVENAYEYVAWLEKMMASHLLAMNNPAFADMLDTINTQLKEIIAQPDIDQKTYLKLNSKFHGLFVQQETNEIVTEQYHFYHDNVLSAIRSVYFPKESRRKAVVAEHDAIISALRNRKEEELVRNVYIHSVNAKLDFLNTK